MPIHEIRETISIDKMTTDDGIIFVERIINLQRGSRHTINAIDVFLDNPYFAADQTALCNIVISSQPLLLTGETVSNVNGWFNDVPAAGVDTILYKGNFDVRGNAYQAITAEFPNNFLGSMPTFSWYTPRLYMYVVFVTGAARTLTVEDFRCSAYIAVENRKASYLSVMLGTIRERSIAQIAKISSLGRVIPQTRITGQTFPMFLYGGARTQFMMNADSLADFYTQLAPRDSEKMLTTAEQRDFIAAARTMVGFDQAFGEQSATLGGVPEWVRLFALTGVVSGAVREQWPPLKYNDNGNVRML
jgi:hypothetical protein